MTEADLLRIRSRIDGQINSIEFWLGEYNRYQDLSCVRNVSIAIGKLLGMIEIWQYVQGLTELHGDLADIWQKYYTIWNELVISKRMAQVYANHGCL